MRFGLLLGVLLPLVAAGDAGAAEQLKLYGEYWHGQPLDQIRSKPGTYVSYDAEGQPVLTEDAYLSGMPVKLFFKPFEGEDRLMSVLLVQEWRRDRFEIVKKRWRRILSRSWGRAGTTS